MQKIRKWLHSIVIWIAYLGDAWISGAKSIFFPESSPKKNILRGSIEEDFARVWEDLQRSHETLGIPIPTKATHSTNPKVKNKLKTHQISKTRKPRKAACKGYRAKSA